MQVGIRSLISCIISIRTTAKMEDVYRAIDRSIESPNTHVPPPLHPTRALQNPWKPIRAGGNKEEPRLVIIIKEASLCRVVLELKTNSPRVLLDDTYSASRTAHLSFKSPSYVGVGTQVHCGNFVCFYLFFLKTTVFLQNKETENCFKTLWQIYLRFLYFVLAEPQIPTAIKLSW